MSILPEYECTEFMSLNSEAISLFICQVVWEAGRPVAAFEWGFIFGICSLEGKGDFATRWRPGRVYS